MSRRRHGRTAASLSCTLPAILLGLAWAQLGEPWHQDGLMAALAAGTVAGTLMPGIVISAGALPMLLVPRRLRCWARHRQDSRPPIPAYLRRAVYFADGYSCCYCDSGGQLQIDHVRPWSLGGLTALWNLATLCGRCNRVKSDFWIERDGFVHYRGFSGSANAAQAGAILAYEKRHRWNVIRWLRAGWSLAR